MPALVGVVLNAEEVVSQLVGEASRLDHAVRVVGVRAQEISELNVLSVVSHQVASSQ